MRSESSPSRVRSNVPARNRAVPSSYSRRWATARHVGRRSPVGAIDTALAVEDVAVAVLVQVEEAGAPAHLERHPQAHRTWVGRCRAGAVHGERRAHRRADAPRVVARGEPAVDGLVDPVDAHHAGRPPGLGVAEHVVEHPSVAVLHVRRLEEGRRSPASTSTSKAIPHSSPASQHQSLANHRLEHLDVAAGRRRPRRRVRRRAPGWPARRAARRQPPPRRTRRRRWCWGGTAARRRRGDRAGRWRSSSRR